MANLRLRTRFGSSRPGQVLRSLVLLVIAVLFVPNVRVFADASMEETKDVRSLNVAELRRRVEADNRNHPVKSVQCAEEGLRLVEGGADPKAEIWFLLALVRDLDALDDYGKAASYVERARPLIARHGSPVEHFQLEVNVAVLFRTQERYADCKAWLDGLLPELEAYAVKHPGDGEARRLHGRACFTRGVAQARLGALEEAIRSFQKAQKLYEEMGDKRGLGMLLREMATLYVNLGRLEEAVRSNLQAIALAEAIGDLDLQASFRLELSNAYATMNDPERQLAELKKAGQLAAKVQDPELALSVAVNLADVYLRKKDYRATLKCADEALKQAQCAKDAFSVALCRINRGVALNRLGNSGDGLRDIHAGLDHFRESPDKGYLVEITGILAEEYAFAGDYRKAYEAQVQFKQLNDEFLKREDQKRIAEASAAFENDKKQFQIDALQKDRRNQARSRLLWIAIGALGFCTALVLVVGRRRLRAANHALAEMSLKDPLTSLANRRYLSTRIEEDLAQIHRLQRDGRSVSPSGRERMLINIDVVFIMIDIDHFKHVNDRYGHGAGDAVLKQFAGVLTSTMRDSDTVVRWGGEEFFVVAKHTAKADAVVVAERIRSRVADHPFDLGNGTILHKTCSIGFAAYPFLPDDPARVPWEKVVEMADQCLYAAKASGRDTWVGVHGTGEIAEGRLAQAGEGLHVPDLIQAGLLAVEARPGTAIVWGSEGA